MSITEHVLTGDHFHYSLPAERCVRVTKPDPGIANPSRLRYTHPGEPSHVLSTVDPTTTDCILDELLGAIVVMLAADTASAPSRYDHTTWIIR